MRQKYILPLFSALLLPLLLANCRKSEEEQQKIDTSKIAESMKKYPTVTVYVSLDREFSQPILDQFSKDEKIVVNARHDVEAAKTLGHVTAILAERDRPRCDVFWNNEIVQTIRLANEGLLEPYKSPSAETIPAQFRDADGMWTGFAARGRVVIYNKEKIQPAEIPASIREWGTTPALKGRFAIAKPLFGTTSTHMAALFTLWGEQPLTEAWRQWEANGMGVLAGNAAVKNDVADGRYAFGLTDTDDAFGAIDAGDPVGLLYPAEGLLIPNSVALIKGAPHADSARKLIDYLLRPETEKILAASASGQIPLRTDVARPEKIPAPEAVHSLEVKWADAAKNAEASQKLMEKLLNESPE